MANTLWTFAKYGKEIFTKLDSGYNFLDQKNFVTHYINREKQEWNNITLTWNTAHWYLGKIFKDPLKRSKSYYSDDFIIWSLRYLFEKTPEWWTVIIQIWPEISKLMNGDLDVQEAFSQNEQKVFIYNIFKKYIQKWWLKKSSKKLIITSFDEQEEKLFESLKIGKEEWNTMKYIESKTKPELDQLDLNSLSIAKYLFWVCQNNKAFFELIKKTKVKWVEKGNYNTPEYYWLIEISCRLHDFLIKNIFIQWWGLRQQKYDNIIKIILYGDSSYPELNDLTSICQEILSNKSTYQQNFQGIYFDGQKNKELLEKQKNAKEIKLKSKAIVYGISAALLAILGYTTTSKIIKNNRIQEQIQLTLDESIKDQHVSIRFDKRPAMSVGEDISYKRQHIEWLAESISLKFCDEYGDGDFTRQDIKLMVLQLLTKPELRDIIDNEDIIYSTSNKNYFIKNILIPHYSMQFIKNGIVLEPYLRYREYEEAFINTLNYDINQTFTIKRDIRSIGLAWNVDYTPIDKIGTYYSWSLYDLWIYKKDGKKYLLAIPHRELNDPYYDYEYDISMWQDIALDYFLQKYPIIEDITNKFLMQYFQWKCYLWHNGRTKCRDGTHGIDSYEIDQLNRDLKSLLVKDFIVSNAYKNITEEISHQQESINKYLAKFVRNQKDSLQKLWFNIVPYQRYLEYQDAFENTLEAQKNGNLEINSIDPVKLANFDYEYLGDYVTKNWDIFWVNLIHYKWKKYIIGREISKPIIEFMGINYNYSDDYSIRYWSQIGEDFLWRIKEYKKQEILKEKSKDTTNIHQLKKRQRKRIYNNNNKK